MLPAGKYFVGDPCYVIADEDWDDLLDETRFFGMYATDKDMSEDRYADREDQNGVFTWNGHKLAASSTAYGDGEYHSNIGSSFSVDAGLIGAIPVELVSDKYDAELLSKLGAVVEFDEDFGISYDDGTITIGHVEIYTGDHDPEAETYWDESEDYYED